ncbi:amidase family protein [Salisediminibacterium selenitireducens]|uniref:Amidase n=1 Tax=Bacillus selenitireducens (strain ATCC 700615 / DSM 15326 / MLS10) TaxID=439292 RepID=D6XXS7_BACIE|nr:amidase family protein [Salisediminibacterium selenitireducens]ADI00120.1 Amidase [[Bacillus] selenitireducens MLS10]
MSFNSETYLQDQVRKQHEEPKASKHQLTLTGEPYDLDDALHTAIVHADITSLQRHVKQGDVTYEDIYKAYYNQVLRHKDAHAVISLNQAGIEEARARTYAEDHHPLYGIPVLVKDNINVAGMPTTAGAVFLGDFVPEEDAALISQLKETGAIVLGKTNLTEWANFMTTDSANGFSALGGQTKNPHGPFDVGGSSAGSGAALALQMSPVAIGTETAGSVIYPASQNGTVGLKPTLTVVSQDGIIPVAASHDTAGPMANTVTDCAYLFEGMTSLKPLTKEEKPDLRTFSFGFLEDDALKQVYRGEDEAILADFKKRLKATGAEVKTASVDSKAYALNIYDVLTYEFNAGVASFFASEPKEASLTEVVAFNEEDPENRACYGQDLMKAASENRFSAEEIGDTVQSNADTAKAALDEAFEEADLLVTISNYATTLYATSGYPALTIPGYRRESGEPVGVTLIGRAYSDFTLLHVGALIEELGLTTKG